MAKETEPAAATEEGKRLVKVTVFIKKKPGISDEEFHRHWSEKHGPLFRSMPIVQQKIFKYSQYHSSPSLNSKGLEVIEFDGAAEFLVTDLESLFSAWNDPEFVKLVNPDEEKFMTREGMKFMVGYEELMFDRTQTS